jgi:hypothetical protein
MYAIEVVEYYNEAMIRPERGIRIR